MPTTGKIQHLHFPEADKFAADLSFAVRIDAGIRAGDTISPWYDPMLAKLIVWGETRNAALQRLRTSLSQCEIAGLTCNLNFLQQLVANECFVRARLSTHLIAHHLVKLVILPNAPQLIQLALAALALIKAERISSCPWSANDG